jgi:hypothetical protein
MLAGRWLLLGGLGWLDYVTGYELSFFVFYSVPVGVAAWWAGRWPGIGVALGATLTWLLANYFSGDTELYTVIPRRTRQHPTHYLGPMP